MKKLFLSTITALMILTASSQSVIQDTTIHLNKPTAKEVAKDLIRLDSTTAELSIAKKNNSLLNENIALKDSIISIKDQQIGVLKQKEVNYLDIIGLKDKEIVNSTELNKSLNKSLKKVKRKSTIGKIASAVIVAVGTYLYITK